MTSRRLATLVLSAGLVVLVGACTPPTTPGPSPTTAGPPTVPPSTPWIDEMLASVNAQRAAVGAAPLSRCASLERGAQAHSADQAAMHTMSHTGSDGSTLGVRADRAGYTGWTYLGENVAVGYGSVSAVMTGWMNSSGHRANILNTGFVHVGFGLAHDGTVPYWTQSFGRSGNC